MVVKKGEFNIIQRRYPENDWDYKAVSVLVDDAGKKRHFIYCMLLTGGKITPIVEIYSGANYVAESDAKSYSKKYDIKDVPRKYDNVLQEVVLKHNTYEWSKAERVESN